VTFEGFENPPDPIPPAISARTNVGSTRAQGKETPIGWTPHYKDIEWAGLKFSEATFDQLQNVDRIAWRKEVMSHEELFIALHDHLPSEMVYERELLICRL
jgi:phosphoenolpyruvate carboxykinase (GTP)